MKSLFAGLALTIMAAGASAQTDVTIHITYQGHAVCNYDVKLKHGDAVIGKGTTDNSGQVVFEQAMLIGPDVDLYAEKHGAVDSHFEINGYIHLNDDFTYELKMEEVLKEMLEDSGMPESMFADSWGLTKLDCH